MNGGLAERSHSVLMQTAPPPLNHFLSIIAGRFCMDFADRLNLKSLCEARNRWYNGHTEGCQLAY